MTREKLASLANKYINILVNARIALCLASNLVICITYSRNNGCVM